MLGFMHNWNRTCFRWYSCWNKLSCSPVQIPKVCLVTMGLLFFTVTLCDYGVNMICMCLQSYTILPAVSPSLVIITVGFLWTCSLTLGKVPVFLLFAIPSAGGTAGAVVTCPLEVVKTRLQSSSGTTLGRLYVNPTQLRLPFQASVAQIHICTSCSSDIPVNRPLPAVLHHGGSKTAGVIFCLRWVHDSLRCCCHLALSTLGPLQC